MGICDGTLVPGQFERAVSVEIAGVEKEVPWCDSKQQITPHFAKYLADWGKEMSWKSVANRFRTSWQTVFRAVESVVEYGLENRVISGVTALGVDEVKFHEGHNYMTLVYQIDNYCVRISF